MRCHSASGSRQAKVKEEEEDAAGIDEEIDGLLDDEPSGEYPYDSILDSEEEDEDEVNGLLAEE